VSFRAARSPAFKVLDFGFGLPTTTDTRMDGSY
jgi:hypothetical protein